MSLSGPLVRWAWHAARRRGAVTARTRQARRFAGFGADTFTGPYVYITDQNHGYADPDMPIGRQLPHNEPVVIGPGCWLGAGATVLPGATIGRNVVVAAGAVVVRGAVPDYSVLAGVPARVVRTITAAPSAPG